MEQGEGDVVLYLHGYTGMDPWFPFLEVLSNRFRVISSEIPGFGESGCPSWVSTMDELAFFYVDILRELNVEHVSLVGSSLGGWLAVAFASHYPSMVRRLVLVDAMGLHSPKVKVADIFLISEEEHMKLRYFKPHGDQLLEKEVDFLEMARASRATAHLGWNPRLHDPKLPHKLCRITAPTLIVWGEEDGVVPPAFATLYQSLIANAQVTRIPQSGHLPQFEQSDLFIESVGSFL
ncbi:alpha/beta fold hydrolase [Alicyclobacillus fastidiosus]|uniref:Alpha/beta hydrolase n=1 Tax=Alicyclobacillus fastidiosus TaxID=392011 RepID=A0ABV5AC19_9BACL|nr:alpha/beta hydrolase [Alicyclobacillus fastidiosus]WEH11470.1 alpha/beta hydrolase [Alicyclobacillus fastidiosus]